MSYGNNYFKDCRLKCRCPHKEKHEASNEILQPTTPREQRLEIFRPNLYMLRAIQVKLFILEKVLIQIMERVNRVLIRLPILEVPRKEDSRINGKGALKKVVGQFK